MIAKRAIYDTFIQAAGGGFDFFHGYPYSGHPLASAAALGMLDTYAKEGLLTRAQLLAADFEHGVHSFNGLPHVVDCRNLGLIGAIEFAPRPGAPGARAKEVFETCWERGVFVRPIGYNIAFCPPLIAEKKHLDEMFGVAAEVVRGLR